MTFVPFHWNEQVEPVHFGASTFLLTLRPGDRHLQTSRALSNLIYYAPVHLAKEIDLKVLYFFSTSGTKESGGYFIEYGRAKINR